MRPRIKGEKVCTSKKYVPSAKEIAKARELVKPKYYIKVFGRLMQITASEARMLTDVEIIIK